MIQQGATATTGGLIRCTRGLVELFVTAPIELNLTKSPFRRRLARIRLNQPLDCPDVAAPGFGTWDQYDYAKVLSDLYDQKIIIHRG
jgi:hypothetical protein